MSRYEDGTVGRLTFFGERRLPEECCRLHCHLMIDRRSFGGSEDVRRL